VHHLQSAGGIPRRFFISPARLGIAPADCILPKRFHFAEQRFASLLAQHLASNMPSERTSRRRGASFRSPVCASNSARRCCQFSGFHKRAIVF